MANEKVVMLGLAILAVLVSFTLMMDLDVNEAITFNEELDKPSTKLVPIVAIPLALAVFGFGAAIIGTFFNNAKHVSAAEAKIRTREALEVKPGQTFDELFASVKSKSLAYHFFQQPLQYQFLN